MLSTYQQKTFWLNLEWYKELLPSKFPISMIKKTMPFAADICNSTFCDEAGLNSSGYVF